MLSPHVGSKLTYPKQFTVAVYSSEGDSIGMETIETDDLDMTHLDYFEKKFKHLSGDLELPLEDRMPGSVEYLDYRIGSDRNGAYVLYYFHDEVIFASLMLSGTDAPVETELMQVFKFLLLDSDDQDEPTEEDIEEILSSPAFDFPAVEQRPAVFEVQLADPDDASLPIEHVVNVNRTMGAAFFGIDRTVD